jgi:hypothetical protein
MHNLKEDRELEEKVREALDTFKASFQEEFDGKIKTLEGKIETKVSEERVREILAENRATGNEHDDQNTSDNKAKDQKKTEIVSDTIKEMNERKSREKNMIIYGLNEPESTNREERLAHDKSEIMEITKTCEVEITEEDIATTKRIGRYDPEKPVRPLMVVLREAEIKRTILRNGNKLKSEESNYKHISLAHDMTRTEREEEKKLWAEAKQRQTKSQGKYIFKVRGPPWDRKIIRINAQVAPPNVEEAEAAPPNVEEAEAAPPNAEGAGTETN